MHEPLPAETLERLNRRIADEIAKAKPQFHNLERYREFIQAQVEAGTSQKAILRTLEKEEGLDVSPDTLSRYVRQTGFRRAKVSRRKKTAEV